MDRDSTTTTVNLLSNASKWEENSLTEFRNALPYALTCSSDNEVFVVAVKTLILDAKFNYIIPDTPILQYRVQAGQVHVINNVSIEYDMLPHVVIDKINENTFPTNLKVGCNHATSQCILTLKDIDTEFSIAFLELLGFIPQDLYQYMTTRVARSAHVWNEIPSKYRVISVTGVMSFTSSKQINAMRLLPKFLEIKISNVLPAISNVEEECIFRHSLNISRKDLSLKIMPKQLEYATSSQTSLSEFKVTIFDDKQQKLQLKRGQCSILQLYIKKMSLGEHKEKFFIQINSAKSSHLFPSNEINNFTAALINPISLGVTDDWSVACRSITIPMNFHHFPLTFEEGTLILQRGNPGDSQFLIRRVHFGKKHFPSNESIIKQLNEALISMTKTDILTCKLSPANLFQLVTNLPPKDDTDATLSLHADLYHLLGGAEPSVDEEFIKCIEDKYVISLKPGTMTFAHPIDRFALIPRAVFVYASIVANSMLGSSETNLLKVYHLEHDKEELLQDQYITLETTHLEYIPLSICDLRYISFQLKDVTGRLLSFVNMDTPALISLVFRQN